ncbi:ACP S-malonyltransferase [bacterium]|nr:ACP S-malonyltransferase [bacterium]
MRKIALLFPGQGAQASGMGLDLYENFEVAKETFEKIDEIMGRKISDLCFNGTDEDLKQTINTQPALLAVSTVAYEVLKKETGIEPSYLAGHSLGEYGALYASGALSLESAFRAIEKRAEYMQEATKVGRGGMAAIIGLEASKVEEGIRGTGMVFVANYNEPNQTVITGDAHDIIKACDILKGLGAKRAIPLAVAGAFHSPFMRIATKKFREFVANLEINDAKIPVITNTDAEITTDKEEIRKKMPTQISSSVQWTKTIQKMLEEGVNTFIEVGQGKVLSGLVKKIAPENTTILNISDKISLENIIEELKNDK